MEDGERAFTKGATYESLGPNSRFSSGEGLLLIDDQRDDHWMDVELLSEYFRKD